MFIKDFPPCQATATIFPLPLSSENDAPKGLMGTLPRSWREKNVVTAVKEDEHPDILRERRALATSRSPAQLAQFSGLGDIPVPSRIAGVFGAGDSRRRKEAAKEAKKRR